VGTRSPPRPGRGRVRARPAATRLPGMRRRPGRFADAPLRRVRRGSGRPPGPPEAGRPRCGGVHPRRDPRAGSDRGLGPTVTPGRAGTSPRHRRAAGAVRARRARATGARRPSEIRSPAGVARQRPPRRAPSLAARGRAPDHPRRAGSRRLGRHGRPGDWHALPDRAADRDKSDARSRPGRHPAALRVRGAEGALRASRRGGAAAPGIVWASLPGGRRLLLPNRRLVPSVSGSQRGSQRTGEDLPAARLPRPRRSSPRRRLALRRRTLCAGRRR